MKKKRKIQLSLFPRNFCDVCGKEVNKPYVCCESCVDEWIESIVLEGVPVFKIKKD